MLPDLTFFPKRDILDLLDSNYYMLYYEFIISPKSNSNNYRNMHVLLLLNFNFYWSFISIIYEVFCALETIKFKQKYV